MHNSYGNITRKKDPSKQFDFKNEFSSISPQQNVNLPPYVQYQRNNTRAGKCKYSRNQQFTSSYNSIANTNDNIRCRQKQPNSAQYTMRNRKFRTGHNSTLSLYYNQFGRAQQLFAAGSSSLGGQEAGSGVSSNTSAQAIVYRTMVPTGLCLFLCNLDRVIMSVAMLPMSAQYNWSPTVQGQIQAAFLYGYTCTQVFGGYFSDKYGAKPVMLIAMTAAQLSCIAIPILLTWRANTAAFAATLTPAVLTLVARLSLGLSEGVCMPAMNTTLAKYVPPQLKAQGLALAFGGFQSGAIIGLLLAPKLISSIGWSSSFTVFGLIGLPALLIYSLAIPTHPPTLNPPPPASTTTLSLRTAATTPALWCLVISTFINHWTYFLFLNWLPTYFSKQLHTSLATGSHFTLIVFVAVAVGGPLSGVLCQALRARGVPLLAVRRVIQSLSFGGPAVALAVLGLAEWAGWVVGVRVAAGVLAVGALLFGFGQNGFVANSSDIAPKKAGTVMGITNTFGSLGGVVGTVCVGQLLSAYNNMFGVVFLVTAGLLVVGIWVWLSLVTTQVVFE